MSDVETGAPGSKKRGGSIWGWIIAAVVAVGMAIALFYVFRPTVVPDLELKSGAQTDALLKSAGLRVGNVAQVATSTVGEGLVIAQSPAATEVVRRHSAVDVTMAAASVPVPMPDVTGLDLETATQKLEEAQFVVNTVDVLETGDDVGTVLAQIPAAGKEWMTGQPVALGVAAGPDDGTGTKVPDIYGDSYNTAVDTLAEAGLLGYGLAVDPTAVNTSEVDQQLPEAGLMVRQGTTVLFLLGER